MKDEKYIAKVDFIEKAINDFKQDLIEEIEKRFYGANEPKVLDIINLIKNQ